MVPEESMRSPVGASGVVAGPTIATSEVALAGEILETIFATGYEIVADKKQTRSTSKDALRFRNELDMMRRWTEDLHVIDGALQRVLDESKELRQSLYRILGEVLGLLLSSSITKAESRSALRVLREKLAFASEVSDDKNADTKDTDDADGSESETEMDFEEFVEDFKESSEVFRFLASSLADELERVSNQVTQQGPPKVNPTLTNAPEYPFEVNILSKLPHAERNLVKRLASESWRLFQSIVNGLEKHKEVKSLRSRQTWPLTSDEGTRTLSRRQTINGTSLIDGLPQKGKVPQVNIAKYSESIATSTAANSSDRPKLPPLPKGAEYGSEFQCHICSESLSSISSAQDWKKHIYADLQPYICTFENCASEKTPGAVRFSTREDWWKHELVHHRIKKTYDCILPRCDVRGVESKEAFLEHVEARHRRIRASTTDKSAAIMTECAREEWVLDTILLRCPFCENHREEKVSKLVQHIAHHFEDQALVVLGIASGNTGERGGDNDEGHKDTKMENHDASLNSSMRVMSPSRDVSMHSVKSVAEKEPEPAAITPQPDDLTEKPDTSETAKPEPQETEIEIQPTASVEREGRGRRLKKRPASTTASSLEEDPDSGLLRSPTKKISAEPAPAPVKSLPRINLKVRPRPVDDPGMPSPPQNDKAKEPVSPLTIIPSIRGQLETLNGDPRIKLKIRPRPIETVETKAPENDKAEDPWSPRKIIPALTSPPGDLKGEGDSKAARLDKKNRLSACRECGKKFPNQGQLRKHTETTHSKPYRCIFMDNCTMAFGARNEWKRHITSMHFRNGWYECREGSCQGKIFNRRDLFAKHLGRMHGYQESFDKNHPEYERCRQEVSSIADRSHVQRKPPTKCNCGFCGQEFTGPQSLENLLDHVGAHFQTGDEFSRKTWQRDPEFYAWMNGDATISTDDDRPLPRHPRYAKASTAAVAAKRENVSPELDEEEIMTGFLQRVRAEEDSQNASGSGHKPEDHASSASTSRSTTPDAAADESNADSIPSPELVRELTEKLRADLAEERRLRQLRDMESAEGEDKVPIPNPTPQQRAKKELPIVLRGPQSAYAIFAEREREKIVRNDPKGTDTVYVNRTVAHAWQSLGPEGQKPFHIEFLAQRDRNERRGVAEFMVQTPKRRPTAEDLEYQRKRDALNASISIPRRHDNSQPLYATNSRLRLAPETLNNPPASGAAGSVNTERITCSYCGTATSVMWTPLSRGQYLCGRCGPLKANGIPYGSLDGVRSLRVNSTIPVGPRYWSAEESSERDKPDPRMSLNSLLND